MQLTIRLRRATAAAITCAALATTLITQTPPAQAAAPPGMIYHKAALSETDRTCQDIVFIGARGSGTSFNEAGGLGSQVDSALKSYTTGVDTAAKSAGRSVRVGWIPVDYPAANVLDLFNVPDPTALPPAPLFKSDTDFFDSIDIGVIKTFGIINKRLKNCPNEKYVLAGHSQGAMVMHQVIQAMYDGTGVADLNTNNRIANSILGVEAIADGFKNPDQGGTEYGTAGADGYGIGIMGAVVPAVGNPYRGALDRMTYGPVISALPTVGDFDPATRWFDVCDYGDVVCDDPPVAVAAAAGPVAAALALKQGGHTHGAYNGTKELNAASTAMANATFNLWVAADAAAPLIINGNPPPITVGAAYSYQLSAYGATPSSQLRWAAAGLPDGITLNPGTGLISGQATQAATGNIIVTLKDLTNGRTAIQGFFLTPTNFDPGYAQSTSAWTCDQLFPNGTPTGTHLGKWSFAFGSYLPQAASVGSVIPQSALQVTFTTSITARNILRFLGGVTAQSSLTISGTTGSGAPVQATATTPSTAVPTTGGLVAAGGGVGLGGWTVTGGAGSVTPVNLTNIKLVVTMATVDLDTGEAGTSTANIGCTPTSGMPVQVATVRGT